MPAMSPYAVSVQDVIYHRPGGEALLARLYIPKGEGPFPAVIDAHGGRWCSETRLTNEVIDRGLAASGIVVMAIDFRMPPLVKFPKPVADINFGVRWLKAHARDYNIHEDWIGAVGTSSGGHQVLLNALLPHDPRFMEDHDHVFSAVDPSLRFVVACWPVTDPVDRYRYARERNMEIHIASHDAYWSDEVEMHVGSPLRIVTDGEAQSLPPLLLVQGTHDVILSPGMSERFAEAYAKAGGRVQLRHFKGEGHTFITKTPDTDSSRAAIEEICSFVHLHTDRLVK